MDYTLFMTISTLLLVMAIALKAEKNSSQISKLESDIQELKNLINESNKRNF